MGGGGGAVAPLDQRMEPLILSTVYVSLID